MSLNQGLSVIGGGALGTMVCARLVKAGVPATLVVRPGSPKDVGSAAVRVTQGQEVIEVEIPVTSSPDGLRSVVCTKAYDAVAAIPAGSVTVLSNGVLAIREAVAVRAATTTHGCYELEAFDVVHAGVGTVWLEDATLAHDFDTAGLNPVLLDERAMNDRLWHKLACNAAINPLTAIFECRNGDVLDKAEKEARAVCDEIAKVRGDDSGDSLFASVLHCVRDTADNVSSMYQDVRHGRRTEIDEINGFILRRAAALGIDAPVNKRLAEAIIRKTHCPT